MRKDMYLSVDVQTSTSTKLLVFKYIVGNFTYGYAALRVLSDEREKGIGV